MSVWTPMKRPLWSKEFSDSNAGIDTNVRSERILCCPTGGFKNFSTSPAFPDLQLSFCFQLHNLSRSCWGPGAMLCAGLVLLACGLAPANPRDAAVGGFSWKADAATVRFASLLSSFRNCFLPLTLRFVFFLVENSIKCVVKQMALLESPTERESMEKKMEQSRLSKTIHLPPA